MNLSLACCSVRSCGRFKPNWFHRPANCILDTMNVYLKGVVGFYNAHIYIGYVLKVFVHDQCDSAYFVIFNQHVLTLICSTFLVHIIIHNSYVSTRIITHRRRMTIIIYNKRMDTRHSLTAATVKSVKRNP